MLNDTQLAVLKTAIAAETDPEFVGYRNNGQTGLMANWYNQPSATMVWGNLMPVDAMFDAIDFANYDMLPAIDGTGEQRNRLIASQNKLLAIQVMLQGRSEINCYPNRTRDSLLVATTDIPSGNNGALRSASGSGGSRILSAMQRAATRGEALYVGAPVTTGSVSVPKLVFEGSISDQDISAALALP